MGFGVTKWGSVLTHVSTRESGSLSEVRDMSFFKVSSVAVLRYGCYRELRRISEKFEIWFCNWDQLC